jgi:hypothetical protein
MEGQSSWDWGPGKRRIQKTAACSRDVVWMEEPLASPDGEKIASVVNLENAVFGLCVNGDLLEQTFEKVWGLSFSPDGRLAAIASTDAEWTVVVDGLPWEASFGFVWNLSFSRTGDRIGAAVQQDMRYGAAVDGNPWTDFFDNASDFALSPCGAHTAAAVQTRAMDAAGHSNIPAGMLLRCRRRQSMGRELRECVDPGVRRIGRACGGPGSPKPL